MNAKHGIERPKLNFIKIAMAKDRHALQDLEGGLRSRQYLPVNIKASRSPDL